MSAESAGSFQVIGHRGAAGHAPENTAPSFELAIELGAHAIELDVHVSKDGIPVVIHDATVNRTTDGEGAVGELTLKELKALDAGAWWAPEYEDTRLLTLEEALDLIASRVPVIIEIKEKERKQRLLDVCRSLLASANPQDVAFSSFSIETLHDAAMAIPDIPREWLVRRATYSYADALTVAKGAPLSRICPSALEVDNTWVDAARDAGLGVRVWGIPSTETGPMVRAMRNVVRSGAEGATADFPDVLITTLRALGR